jgi:hypothetical protein
MSQSGKGWKGTSTKVFYGSLAGFLIVVFDFEEALNFQDPFVEGCVGIIWYL